MQTNQVGLEENGKNSGKKGKTMLPFTEKKYIDPIPTDVDCVLGADIGGTNSNFGIFEKTNDKLKLILSLHFKSQEITDFTKFVADTLSYLEKKYGLFITHSCFAAAGVVSEHRDRCKPTNLDFTIDANELIQKTSLECATLANDFEIIGHGLMLLKKNGVVQVKKGSARKNAVRVILGAGTGLGKCILQWHESLKRFMPMPSEGGHADFAAQTQEELGLIDFIESTEQRTCNISWEDVLSGNGIIRIYNFFRARNSNQPANEELKKNGLHPDKIFASRNLDDHARQTFRLYTTLYARCAKNFALDALGLGGVYIAGGIASKNLELFERPEFLQEFVNCGKQKDLLKKVPIFVITDYNVSLYGAAQFMLLEKTCIS